MKNPTLPVNTRILFLFTLLYTAVASVQSIHATTITVINTNDSGSGSLRQALSDANNGDTIDFDSSLEGQIITLTSGQLLVNRSVGISGLGADNLTVDGNANDRVFYINPNNTVTISGLTITNGVVVGDGAGIYNDRATLTVSNCTVSDNSGSGIFNLNAELTVSNCTISGNSGCGIFNLARGDNDTLTVTNCTISGNSGGGIFNYGFSGSGTATLTITNCTVSGNSGGGIDNYGSYGAGATLTITNSTVSGNSAGYGGGIRNRGQGDDFSGGSATLTVTNSTLSGNSASFGGGIYNNAFFGGATITITNSTLSGNSASQGGGIYNVGGFDGITTLTIGETILNAGALGENIYNEFGTVSSLGYNLSSDNGSGYLTGLGDQINTDPMLGALQDNGGPTFTHALLPGSPAIDTGDPNFTPPPFYDQRGPGFDRVVNGRIDIGSFEVQGPTPTPTPTPTATPTATPTPRPTPTPRLSPIPRLRPTPAPRP